MKRTDDLISRATATRAAVISVRDYLGNIDMERDIHIEKRLNEVPAVDAIPVVHGRWVKMTGMMPPEYHGHYQCSKCEWHMKGLRNSWTREEEMLYCPNCGAKMDEGEEKWKEQMI